MEKAIVIVTCLKRAEIKLAAAGVKATGKEFLFVEEEDGCCTVFGTDEIGNAADLRADATLAVKSADVAYVTAELPHGLPKDAQNMTFRLRGIAPTVHDEPVIVTVSLAPTKDSAFKAVTIDLPCVVTQQAREPRAVTPPAIVVQPQTPVVGGVKPKLKPVAPVAPHVAPIPVNP